MSVLFALVCCIVAGGVLAAAGTSASGSALVFALLAGAAAVAVDGFGFAPALFAAVAVVLAVVGLAPLRDLTISRPLFRFYRKALPALSATEKEAIDAGTVWWDGELFSGKPDWERLLGTGKPEFTARDRAFIDGPLEQLCKMAEPWKHNTEWSELPPHLMEFLKRERFFAMIIPEEYGGLGLSAVAQTEVITRLQACGNAIANLITVPNSLGPGELLLKYGTEEQKNYYLPRLASGEEIPCFALTGPTAGSDATSLPDTGVVCRGEWQGEEVLGLRLNFSKRYITLAPIATLVGLAFRMRDPDGLLGEAKDYGITCALLPRDLPGMDIGRRHLPIGDNFFNGPIEGHDVFVPLSQIIGGPDMAGKGWTMLVNCLSVGRCISLPSAANGIAIRSLAGTTAYASLREQFGLPIAKFEGVQAPIARIAGMARIVNAARLHTAQALDHGEKPSVASAILKYHATELSRVAINDAMDVHGGKAVMRGPKNYLADFYGGTPIAITVEGANILTRNLMVFGQGATRSHPLVLRQMRLAHSEPTPAVMREFGSLMVQHVGFVLGNASRSFLMGLTGGRLAPTPREASPVSRYYRKLNRLSTNFALVADVSMLVLQGRLKFMEMLSARLGDLLSNLYLCSMVLKDYEDAGCPEEALPSVEWACDFLIHRYLTAYAEIIENFPVRPVAALLRGLTQPFGIRTRGPSDALTRRVARLVTADTATRRSMLTSAFLEPLANNPLGRANAVFLESEAFAEAKKRVARAAKAGEIARGTPLSQVDAAIAAGVLEAEEGARLRAHLERVMDLVHVDDFASREAIAASREPTAAAGEAPAEPWRAAS